MSNKIEELLNQLESEFIAFGDWIRIKDFQVSSRDKWIGLDLKEYTTKELFEKFKQETK